MPEWKLDPAAVRKTARAVPGCVEDSSLEGDTVMSFLVGLDSKDTANLARINVYTVTGTIGTCRVLEGQVREIFKRNVSSVSALKRMLTNPPLLTTVGDTLNDGAAAGGGNESLPDKMELAEVGMCILLSDKEKLQHHLESCVDAAREKDQDVSGMDFEFGLPKKVMKQVEQCLTDILSMGKYVTCVATNGKGAVFLYGHGGVAYTPGIPKHLHQKLKQLKHGRASTLTTDTRPSYVALGTRDRYYVQFHDGSADWKGPKALDKLLKNCRLAPRSVAFGEKYDSYFVVFEDGSWECNDIPEELNDKLADRVDHPDLVCVTMGPSGAFFLRAASGKMWWGGISEELDIMIQSLLETDRYLNFIDFGEDSSYFLSYD
eukprot:CAMPEP_0202482064 /NCGR_PEP_ID=MMETSP1361-20130828/1515_1 /ASSEMBLY_ACC=CAM_ASM_000849 /TAXON_ID=210615 /ORGANISM="Staurosira complex sp., Strain CCMP2646" /LENGTH=374 /DNA_ID=CAMNT_0049109785 /DNA_START=84 /DNA_END=1208 /DNA_ORIENTATION=-